ncbi:aspartate kinase [bacterium]|nr:aspartate kinase [bacterium]
MSASPPILVRKYGGSSLASVERIRTVARDLKAARDRGYRLVVVVSAMGKTTDELGALAAQAHPSPPRRELDMLLSVGERITMSLLSMALADAGCPAISFTGSQCGIITDSSHSDARILEVKGDRVRDALEQGFVVVVAGFQGVSREREITTLGRGGSDTTAVALAAALGAVRCEILKDVDGVLAADPRLVPEPGRHDRLTWDEMRAVAESGCGVVHLRAVEYAAEKGVPLVVRSSFHDGPGTAIGTVPVDDAVAAAAPDAPDPCAGGACGDRENRYRPLVLNAVEAVTRIRLAAPDGGTGRRWRDILLAHLDPALTVAEWLDSADDFRWEGWTRQTGLAPLRDELLAAGADPTWEPGLACVSLAGGRPDSWLEVQRHVGEVMADLPAGRWRMRADGSALRLLVPAPLNPALVRGLHGALLAERTRG